MGLNSNYILADSDLLGSFGFEDYSVFLNVDDKSFLQHLHKEAELGDFEESLKYYSAAALLHKHSKAKLLPSYLNLSGNLGVRST